ncbi:MAG: radical SAM protein [bacterium]|nr:radical SAM protein [bacterium]
MTAVFHAKERYFLFRHGEFICRYGMYGMTREYYSIDHTLPPEKDAEIEIPISAPRVRTMQAVITSECNLHCHYCSFSANAPILNSRKMSRAEIEALCREFNSEMGADGLLLITGGEPELYREAVDFLVENIVGKIIMFTNGTRTEPDRLRYYRDHSVGVLFSLDGDLFAHNIARPGAGGSYNRVAQALKEARELGLDYGISAVVGDHNIDRLPELVETIFDEFRPASLGLNLPHHHHDIVWNRIEEYTNALIRIFHFARSRGLFVDQINRRFLPLASRRFRLRDCAAQGEKRVIFPGGIRTSCVNEAGLKNRQVDWGNRLPLTHGECQNCFALAICGGGCIFDGEAINGSNCFDERNCYLTRKLLEFMIWELWETLGDAANDFERIQATYAPLLKRGGGTHFSVGHETGA